jgi:multicomponent Na+:H+ antiporter subunit E
MPDNDKHARVRHRIQQATVLAVVLAVLWLVLSGHYSALLVAFGALSVALSVWIAMRAEAVDPDLHPAQFRLLPCLAYAGWLAREVVLSAVDVSRRILSADLRLEPTVVRLPLGQRTDAGRAIYANSITLTPGTVSIDLSAEEVEVHALTREGAEALASGEMNRRVAALERGR